jgi:hypothetical protein
LSATAIAVITWVVGLAAIVGGLFEIRRLRQSDVPQHKINQFTVALLVITGAATVTELVALGTEPQPSPDSSQSTAGLVALIVTNVATTAFVIAVVVLRSRRVRRETARLGEPPLTRRASLRVAAPGTDALYWSKVALHAIDAVNIEIDLDALQISAETQGQWNDVGRYV